MEDFLAIAGDSLFALKQQVKSSKREKALLFLFLIASCGRIFVFLFSVFG